MGEEAGDGEVSGVDGMAAGVVEVLEEVCVSVGLGVVFGAGIEGASAEGNAEDRRRREWRGLRIGRSHACPESGRGLRCPRW